jgi:hypothetical protein
LLPLCPSPCPNPTSLNIFVLISPPLSLIAIKGMPLLIQRVALRGRWLTLKYCIFDGHFQMLEWHHLYSSWDTTHRIVELDTNWWDTSPYVIAWVIHLINLSSC